MKTEPDHYAFPLEGVEVFQRGITKREYFAAMAMQGLTTAEWVSVKDGPMIAVKFADALIEALNREKES
jgi:hypothetical protein